MCDMETEDWFAEMLAEHFGMFPEKSDVANDDMSKSSPTSEEGVISAHDGPDSPRGCIINNMPDKQCTSSSPNYTNNDDMINVTDHFGQNNERVVGGNVIDSDVDEFGWWNDDRSKPVAQEEEDTSLGQKIHDMKERLSTSNASQQTSEYCIPITESLDVFRSSPISNVQDEGVAIDSMPEQTVDPVRCKTNKGQGNQRAITTPISPVHCDIEQSNSDGGNSPLPLASSLYHTPQEVHASTVLNVPLNNESKGLNEDLTAIGESVSRCNETDASSGSNLDQELHWSSKADIITSTGPRQGHTEFDIICSKQEKTNNTRQEQSRSGTTGEFEAQRKQIVSSPTSNARKIICRPQDTVDAMPPANKLQICMDVNARGNDIDTPKEEQTNEKQPQNIEEKAKRNKTDSSVHFEINPSVHNDKSQTEHPKVPSTSWNIVKKDFVPEKSERFSSILKRVSEYIGSHPQERPMSLEVVLLEEKPEEIKVCKKNKQSIETRLITDENKVTISHVHGGENYFRILRLWLTRDGVAFPGGGQKVNHIACVTIVPEYKGGGNGINDVPKFESLWDALVRFNRTTKSQPIPGKILSIQTDTVMFEQWSGRADTEQVYPNADITITDDPEFDERERGTYYLRILRVFYLPGKSCKEMIGYRDFIPRNTGARVADERFDSLEDVLPEVQVWIGRQEDKRVTNLQTLEYNLQKDLFGRLHREVSGDAALFYEKQKEGAERTIWGRLLRIYYVGPIPARKSIARTKPNITTKTFHPGGCDEEYNFDRMFLFLKHVRPHVITVETTGIPLEDYGSVDKMISRAPPERCLSYRVFMDGAYPEPPAGIVPPLRLTPLPAFTRRNNKNQMEQNQGKAVTKSTTCALM